MGTGLAAFYGSYLTPAGTHLGAGVDLLLACGQRFSEFAFIFPGFALGVAAHFTIPGPYFCHFLHQEFGVHFATFYTFFAG